MKKNTNQISLKSEKEEKCSLCGGSWRVHKIVIGGVEVVMCKDCMRELARKLNAICFFS